MRRSPKRCTLVLVHWLDASYQAGELSVEHFETRCELFSAGHLVREDKATVSLGMDYCPSSNDWRHVMHIPKVNIVRMSRVKV